MIIQRRIFNIDIYKYFENCKSRSIRQKTNELSFETGFEHKVIINQK